MRFIPQWLQKYSGLCRIQIIVFDNFQLLTVTLFNDDVRGRHLIKLQLTIGNSCLLANC